MSELKTNNQNNSLNTTEQLSPKRMSVKEFVTRLCLYVLIGAVIPFVYLVWKFNLFTPQPSKEEVTLGGWGIIAIIFIAIFFLKTLKAIRKGMVFSAYTKTIDAITKLFIPLFVSIVIVNFLGNIQEELLRFLIVLFICAIPATVVNPIPRWAYENKIEEISFGVSKIISSVKNGLESSKGEKSK